MFSKKTNSSIDHEQLALIENAQRRIKQKKYLYIHFVLFLIGTVLLIIANMGLGIGKSFTILGVNWFVYAILIWLFLVLYHVLNVFVINKFMGKDWEKKELTRLVSLQKNRIEKLKNNLEKEALHIAESEIYQAQQVTTKSNLTIIVAAGKNNEIGKNNALIWHLRDDLKRFKKLTSGHCIIMGRKTFESFPKPLPNRTHIVVTRQTNYNAPEGVLVVNTIEQAIELAKHDSQPFIIGGGEIYKLAMPYVSKIELTRVHASFDADTYFPNINFNAWNPVAKQFHEKDENHGFDFTFFTFEKKK